MSTIKQSSSLHRGRYSDNGSCLFNTKIYSSPASVSSTRLCHHPALISSLTMQRGNPDIILSEGQVCWCKQHETYDDSIRKQENMQWWNGTQLTNIVYVFMWLVWIVLNKESPRYHSRFFCVYYFLTLTMPTLHEICLDEKLNSLLLISNSGQKLLAYFQKLRPKGMMTIEDIIAFSIFPHRSIFKLNATFFEVIFSQRRNKNNNKFANLCNYSVIQVSYKTFIDLTFYF